MVAQVPFLWQLADMLGGIGLGILLALFYDLMRLFLPGIKPIIFICDVFTFIFAAVWIFSYSVSISRSGVLRWYIIAGAALGYLCYIKIISPLTVKFRLLVHFVVNFPFKLIHHYILLPVKNFIVKTVKNKQKKPHFFGKSSKKQLQNNANVLYNSN